MPMVHIGSPTSRAAKWGGGWRVGNHHVCVGGRGRNAPAPRTGTGGSSPPQMRPPAANIAPFLFSCMRYCIASVRTSAEVPYCGRVGVGGVPFPSPLSRWERPIGVGGDVVTDPLDATYPLSAACPRASFVILSY